MPQTLTVTRAFTANRVRYTPGQVIPAEELVHVRSADMLLSLRYVIPTPDPHSRKGKPERSTPTAMPATVRKQVLKEPAGPPLPTAIIITPATQSVVVGGAGNLDSVITPAEADQNVTYSTADTTIIDLNTGTGAFTALAAGTATITGSADAAPTVTDTAVVTVTLVAGDDTKKESEVDKIRRNFKKKTNGESG